MRKSIDSINFEYDVECIKLRGMFIGRVFGELIKFLGKSSKGGLT